MNFNLNCDNKNPNLEIDLFVSIGKKQFDKFRYITNGGKMCITTKHMTLHHHTYRGNHQTTNKYTQETKSLTHNGIKRTLASGNGWNEFSIQNHAEWFIVCCAINYTILRRLTPNVAPHNALLLEQP